MTRLLFLDFDGVLHPTSAPPGQRFGRADLLASALAGHDCGLVVSSSWRFHHDFDDLVAPLPSALRERVVGVTGEARFGRWPRYQEIRAYLRDAAPGAAWRALDDSWNEFPPSCPELIACDPNVGLDTTQLKGLQRWLR